MVVLSEDYLSSKWPMIELAEFVRASKSGNKNLNLLPLFYKASVSDLDDKSIKDKWRPKWMELAGVDPRVDPEEWAEAVRELRRVNGLNFHKFENSESYRDAIVKDIFRLAPPDLLFDTSKILGWKRICEVCENRRKSPGCFWKYCLENYL